MVFLLGFLSFCFFLLVFFFGFSFFDFYVIGPFWGGSFLVLYCFLHWGVVVFDSCSIMFSPTLFVLSFVVLPSVFRDYVFLNLSSPQATGGLPVVVCSQLWLFSWKSLRRDLPSIGT